MSLPPPGEPGETPEQRQARYNAAAAAHLRANPSSANRDPGFDINTATNTFYKALADRLKSGQMTLDQARAAQAEMRALQLNPAAANRQAATDIAQRHLQVGQYSPANVAARQAAQQPQGGLTLAQPAQETARRPYAILGMPTPENGMAPQIKQQTPTQAQVDAYYAGNPDMNNSYWNPYAGSFETRPQVSQPSAPQGVGGMGQSVNPVMPQPPMPVSKPPEEIMVTPYRMPEIVTPPQVSQPQELPVTPTQPDMPERHSEYGIPLWMQLGAGPERDAAYAQYMKAQRGEMQPKFIGKNFTGDAPPPGKKYIETPEGLVPVPINDVPVKPAMGPGLGRALGMPMQGVGMAPQMPMPYNPINTTRLEDIRGRPGSGMGIGAFLGSPGQAIQGGGMMPRLAEMLKPKMPQSTGVDNTTFIAGDPNFRFGETPQVKAPNAQGMAMGGLLRKYYGGGMC